MSLKSNDGDQVMSVVLDPLGGLCPTDGIDDVPLVDCVSEVLRDGVTMVPNENRRLLEGITFLFAGDDAEVFMLLRTLFCWI